jgi:hypothetical protein
MIQTGDDGSALIRLVLTYTNPQGTMDLTEVRRIYVAPPAADGSYAFDWIGTFTAGEQGAFLDRTPMPEEPNGQFNGGYAGLGIRMAASPLTMSVVTPDGPITEFRRERSRPIARVVACNFQRDGKDVGGLAVFSDPANHGMGDAAPWYVINGEEMRFLCAAVLAPQPIQLNPGQEWELRYRIALRPTAWTPEALQAAIARP